MDPVYISPINRGVEPARPGEFPPVAIGPICADPPIVLAPMAGITNAPFRRLCRGFGAGLYVSEMITARALVERNEKTMRLSEFDPDESPRSLQLYGVDPHYVGESVKLLVAEDRIDHLDMNFGCPVKKVTRRGGGAAIPAKPRLLEAIVRAAVRNAGAIPVTIKFRIGIEAGWNTFLEAGRIAEGEGCRAVALHARTAAQLYDGEADWNAIGELAADLSTWELPAARTKNRKPHMVHRARGLIVDPDLRYALRRVPRIPHAINPPATIARPGDAGTTTISAACTWTCVRV